MKDLVKKIGTPKVAFFIAAALALIVIFGMMMTSTGVGFDQNITGHGHTH